MGDSAEHSMEIVIGGLLGIITGLITGYIFYWLGGRSLRVIVNELMQETDRIKRLNEINLLALEHAGLVKLNRDEHGTIVGRLIEVGADLESRWNVEAVPTVDSPLRGAIKPSGK